MPAVDFSKAGSIEPLTGTYDARLTKLTYGLSNASGQPKFDFEFTLSDPQVEGRKAWASKSLQEQGLWATKEWLIALGYDAEKLSGVVDTDDIIAECVGVDCRVVLSTRMFEGKERQQIDKVLGQYDIV